jgi:uncharacterized protein involved in cysteine biosynthesis
MKDKYRAYLWAIFWVVIFWNFEAQVNSFINLFGLPDWAEILGFCLLLILPMAYWLRNERGPGVVGVVVGFIVGVLIGKSID